MIRNSKLPKCEDSDDELSGDENGTERESLESDIDDENNSEGNNDEPYDSMIENGTECSSDHSEKSNDEDDDRDDEVQTKNIQGKVPIDKNKQKQIVENIKQLKRRKNPAQIDGPEVKKNKSEFVKPPTLDEINQLNETQNLFHSNLFRFQIDEMLREIQIKDSVWKEIDLWIENFNDFLSSIKVKNKTYDFEKISRKYKSKFNVSVPFDLTDLMALPFKNRTFEFIKPDKKVKLIGSARLKTMIGPNYDVDLVLAMPSKMFSAKINEDNLNGKYYLKRGLYITQVAIKLKKQQDYLVKHIQFSWEQNCDNYNPILIISPKLSNEKLESKIRFILRLGCETGSFKVGRFAPTQNNIRTIRAENLFDLPATPYYNQTILRSMKMFDYNEFADDTLENNENYRNGIKLIKIWLKQRHLDDDFIGMNGFIVTMMICYLIQNRKITKTMSSYQVVRTFWNFIKITDLHKTGVSLWKPFQTSPPSIELFHQYFDVVFLDPTGFYNFAYNLNLEIYERIRYEADMALNVLNQLKHDTNTFRDLFMTNMSHIKQFDHIISIKIEHLSSVIAELNKNTNLDNNLICLLSKIVPILKRGLDKRVFSITPFINFISDGQDLGIANRVKYTWDLHETAANSIFNQIKTVNFGLILNPEYSFDILIRGPPANDAKSKEFRDFWGEHSTLRRFHDGSIIETVVLCSSIDHVANKRLITKRIVEIVFERHLKINTFNYIADQMNLNDFLKLQSSGNEQLMTQEEVSLNVIKVFDEIGKSLRAIDSDFIPLTITSFQGVSPVFRYCELNPTIVKATSKNKRFYSKKIYHGKIQLVTSGKWPNSLEAIRRLKAAFYIKFSNHLRHGSFARAIPHCDGVDVLKEGHVFRLSIVHPKELSIIKQQVNGNGVLKYRDSGESIQIEKEDVLLLKLTSCLHGLYMLNPAFGATVCLAKKWLYSHYIDQQLIPDECTELLVAYLFIKSQPYNPPHHPQLGFIRFLTLLSETDWLSEYILLNFNDELTEEQITEIDKSFSENRDQFPSLCIITSCDADKLSVWSRLAPCENILARIILLARHSLLYLEQNLLNSTNATGIYGDQATKGYNYVIHLNILSDTEQLAGLDLVNVYLKELREAYSVFALFFYNPYKQDRILVLFRPETMLQNDFKISQVNGCKLNANGKLVFNEEAIVQDFEIIGKGLVKRIQKLTNK